MTYNGHSITLSIENSFFTNPITPDLSARTYAIGSYVTVPLVNKYYPQITTISGYDAGDISIGLGYNNTASDYYLAPVFMSCSLGTGINGAYVKNANGTAPYQNWQAYYFNFEATARKNIDFIYASDSNSSTIYIPAGGSHTFVIGVNNSESLSGVGWYVSRQFADGSFGSSYPVIPTTDKNMSFTYAPSDNYGRFRVEAQLEDTYCVPHRFVTYTWYVSLGSSVSLSGYVSTGIMNTAVPNVTVEIQCPSGESDRLTTTDANGVYSFTGLGAGEYTLDIAKTGYSCAACPDTFTLNATLDGENPYNRDYSLTVAGVTTTTLAANTIVMFSPNWRNVTDGEFQYIGVSYYYAGVPITGGSCNFSSSATLPASGNLDVDGTGYSQTVQVSGSGTSTYTVTCSKTGYDTKSATDTFYIHTGGDIYAEIEWLGYSTQVVAGSLGTYRIWYGSNNLGMVEYATCNLHVDGTEYTMAMISGDGSGEFAGQDGYSGSVVFTEPGVYEVYATCSKTGYINATSEIHSVYVTAGSPPTTLSNHCADLVKNYDETDIDCGGSCAKCAQYKKCKASSDCLSNYCSSGICRSPSCSDDIKNGDESGIDCGGSCYPCACFKNSDCAQDGSEHCQDYSCVRDNCTTTCSSITWSSATNPVYDRERYCVRGICSFTGSGNTTTELTIQIAPSGPYYTWNNSGVTFYVSNCEEKTNGFTVSSSNTTQKSYFHLDPSVSPFVPVSASAQTFSAQYTLTYLGLIPKLCEIPVGSKNVSSLIVFYLNDGTSGFKTRSVYSLTFRDRFKGNASYRNDELYVNLSRPGSCKFRASTLDAWTQVEGVGSVLLLENASKTNRYQIYCNNSYGESISFTFGRDALGLEVFSAIYGWCSLAGDSFIISLTGQSFSEIFVWRPEYIILIVICVFILFPATVTFLIFAVMNRRKPASQYKGKA